MKVVIEYDTKEKALTVSKDGKAIENVDRVEFWNFSLSEEGPYHMEIGQREENEDEGTVVRTRILANKDIFGKEKTEELSKTERLSRLLFQKK